MKRTLALILAAIMLLATLSACSKGGNGSSGDTVEITCWIPTGEDSTYYMSYEENPAVKYLETKEFNGHKIDLKFTVPITGSELDNFNTLLMTDEYCDVIDMAYATQTAAELYEDGYTWDLTKYVEQYMPNYMAILNNNPDLAPLVYNKVDGERKILSLFGLTDEPLGNFMGFNYRRDWIAKYGKNPQTGAAFTYGYTDPADYETYYDDVVFPSGGSAPVYISDWEWMFGIFETAMKDLGITDGYCISIYFKGYSESGDGFYNSFGGGGPLWYKDKDTGDCMFGATSESMQAYLEMLNNWYKKGWLDPAFAERTSDQVYAVNSPAIHAGKVGAFVGRRAETGGQMDMGDPLTKGIMIYGARPPINDIYGSDAVKGKEPYSMYQYSRIRSKFVVSNKVSEEELPTVLTFLDYLYGEEGAPLMCFGLTEEQFNETQDEVYKKYNITYGVRIEDDGKGGKKYIRNEALHFDNNLASAMAGKRLMMGYYLPGFRGALNTSYVGCALNAMNEWDYYLNTGAFDKALLAQFTPDESNTYNKVHANVDTHLSTNLPKFIKGDLDIYGTDWDNFCKMLMKYSPDKITKAYQRILDEMK